MFRYLINLFKFQYLYFIKYVGYRRLNVIKEYEYVCIICIVLELDNEMIHVVYRNFYLGKLKDIDLIFYINIRLIIIFYRCWNLKKLIMMTIKIATLIIWGGDADKFWWNSRFKIQMKLKNQRNIKKAYGEGDSILQTGARIAESLSVHN